MTVVSNKLYKTMPEAFKPPLQPLAENVQLQAADKGLLVVHINIDDETFEWDAYVADICDDGLIGFDFLHHFNCSLEARRGLRINNRLVPTVLKTELTGYAVYVKSDVVIPASSEFIVSGRTDALDGHEDRIINAIIEPISNREGSVPLHVARCLVDVARHSSDLPVCVVNTGAESIHLYSGTQIASIQPVSEIYELDDDGEPSSDITSNIRGINVVTAQGRECDTDTWPDNLKALYERSWAGLNPYERDQLAALIGKHQRTFAKSPTDHGRTSIVQHAIDTGDAVPIKQRPRRPPRAFEQEEEKIITDQLDAGIIRESTSAWSSPLVYVKKRDGTTRQCVDYRKLNDVTRKDAYPLPLIEDCLDCLGGAKFFSTLDLQSGYWQLEIKEEDRPKTAFSTRTGHYEYVTMPFGLCNAPSTFERAMELLMKGLQWRTLILYLDDIVVMGSTFDEHVTRLDEVLDRLGNAGLKLKPSKCHLFKSEVSYLGHVVNEFGIKPDPEKVERIHSWPTPTTVSDVRSFLGLCSYYRRFIRGFSSIAAPLNKLTEKSQPFDWTAECEAAFLNLKQAIVSDNVMAYPNDEGMFILDTDASAVGIGAVLSQMQWDEVKQQEVERPVAFASRSLTRTQRLYCTTRRELLAVVSFVRNFRHFLLGRKFLIRTDHSSLRWIMSFREPTDQMARWIEILAQFDFEIEHREGKKHANADALSRISCDPDTCECYDNASIVDNLPCGGCNTCMKRHREWSDFFDEDDIVPLSSKKVNVIHSLNSDSSSENASVNCDKATTTDSEDFIDSNRGNFLCYIMVIAMLVVSLAVGSLCGPLHRWMFIGLMCLLGMFILGFCGIPTLRVLHCVFKFDCSGLWPTLVNIVRVNRVSMSRKTRNNSKSIDDNGSDNLPCVSDKGTDAGSFSGQQGITFEDFDRAELAEMQRNDVDIGIVYGWLMDSPRRPDRGHVHDKSPAVRNLWLSWSQLSIIDGLLYKQHDTNSKLTGRLQLVVPAKLRDHILRANHTSLMSGHLGIKKTLSRIQRSFYWHNMKESVRLFLANCVVCGARKRPTSKPKAPLGEYNVGSPMDRVALDIMGPFPTSNKGNRYVLVVGDTFTKWVEAYGIPDQSARTVADVVVHEFISRFGTPLELHSDQGKTFESNLFQSVCKLLEITKTRTTPYHPSSNGMIERFNQTLVNMISSFVDKKQENWDEHLPLLTAAYRSAVHESTGFSPNFLMLGREVKTPVEIALGVDRPDTDQRDHDEYAASIAATMRESHQLAREHLAKNGTTTLNCLLTITTPGTMFTIWIRLNKKDSRRN